jgi:predicted metal-dependent enzyme (double-stranded beta helix superfamily)
MFDLDELLKDCQQALTETEPRRATREILERTVAHPDDVAAALQPREGGLAVLYNAPDLTVVHAIWAPGMRLFPHDHRMWAAIAIYAGQEDNAFYRRTAPEASTLVDSGGREVTTGEVLLLGDDAIHSVANSRDRLTAAIHVYVGDFVHQPRSQWGPGPVEERPFDMSDVNRAFDDANRVWTSTQTPSTS